MTKKFDEGEFSFRDIDLAMTVCGIISNDLFMLGACDFMSLVFFEDFEEMRENALYGSFLTLESLLEVIFPPGSTVSTMVFYF